MLKEDYLSSLTPLQGEKKKNVILILVDCLRARNVDGYGQVIGDTPNLDALAGQGFIFRNAFSQVPHTQPSTASIFTSLYPSVHKINTPSNRFDPEILRMGEIFNHLGYDTAAFVANPHINPDSGHLEGIHYFSDGRDWLARKSWSMSHWGEDSRVLNQRFMDWFRRQHDPAKPFFAFIFYIDPHIPYTSLPNGLHRFLDRKLYYADLEKYQYTKAEMGRVNALYRNRVRYVDGNIGQLLDFLKRRGAWNDTVLIVSADHGEGLDKRAGHGLHGGVYEKGIHVPFIISAPWLSREPQVFEQLIASIDILPSVLDLVQVPPAKQFQGKSFAPLLRGERFTPRDYVAGEYNFNRYVRTARWKYINNGGGIRGASPRWSESEEHLPEEEVYRPDRDPDETRNLVDAIDLSVLMQLRGYFNSFVGSLETTRFAAEKYDVEPEVLRRLRGLGYVD